MAAVILEACCVAPFVVRVCFSDDHEGEANLRPCLFEWEAARVPDLSASPSGELAPTPLSWIRKEWLRTRSG